MEARQDDLLPIDYYHVVFTIPSEMNPLAYQNKAVVYGILFKAVSKTLTIISRDKKHLGAKLGATLVLHTWGSAMTHHPHIHGIIPGGGLSAMVNNGLPLNLVCLLMLAEKTILHKYGNC